MEMLAKYIVEKPASEAELGDELRARAMGEKVLELVVISDVLDSSGEPLRRDFRLSIDSIHLTQGDSQLPYLVGTVFEKIGEEEFIIGVGQLEVTGSPQSPENERPLVLRTASAA